MKVQIVVAGSGTGANSTQKFLKTNVQPRVAEFIKKATKAAGAPSVKVEAKLQDAPGGASLDFYVGDDLEFYCRAFDQGKDGTYRVEIGYFMPRAGKAAAQKTVKLSPKDTSGLDAVLVQMAPQFAKWVKKSAEGYAA